MNKIWKIAATIILSTALLLICGCQGSVGSAGTKSLDYQNCPAKFTLSGEVCGMTFSAALTLGVWDGRGSRTVNLTYNEPEVLRGVSVICHGGVWAVNLGELTLSGTPAERLALPAQVFSLTGEVTFIGTEPLPGGGRASVLSVVTEASPEQPLSATARIRVSHNGGHSSPVSVFIDLSDGRSANVNVTEYVRLPEGFYDSSLDSNREES